ncbi:hypothetical protein [Bradyrhizobium lablabi]|nr:hypothetical protein [Bradyrhizobium lablabi]MBR0692392.1 hypothetical protein [Bradyrhizobium lablabi]
MRCSSLLAAQIGHFRLPKKGLGAISAPSGPTIDVIEAVSERAGDGF